MRNEQASRGGFKTVTFFGGYYPRHLSVLDGKYDYLGIFIGESNQIQTKKAGKHPMKRSRFWMLP